jgi:sugar phosphate isomerase/epimerase
MFRRTDPRDQIIADQRAQIADLLDRLQELVGSVHMHQVAIHAQNHRQQDAGPIDRGIAGESGYMSEDEADLRYQAEAGMIDNDALKEALKQLGFENAEITFD